MNTGHVLWICIQNWAVKSTWRIWKLFAALVGDGRWKVVKSFYDSALYFRHLNLLKSVHGRKEIYIFSSQVCQERLKIRLIQDYDDTYWSSQLFSGSHHEGSRMGGGIIYEQFSDKHLWCARGREPANQQLTKITPKVSREFPETQTS